MDSSRPVATFMEKLTLREQRSDKPGANQLENKKAIGSLQYTATISQPHLSFACKIRQELIVDSLGGSEVNTSVSTWHYNNATILT